MRALPPHVTNIRVLSVLTLGVGLSFAVALSLFHDRPRNRPSPQALQTARLAAVLPPVPASAAVSRATSSQLSEASAELKALQAEVASAQQAVAVAQLLAMENAPESEQPATLAAFADTHRRPLDEAAALEQRLRHPQTSPALGRPLPEAKAAKDRFTAVRHSIVNEGLSLEAAEALLEPPPPEP